MSKQLQKAKAKATREGRHYVKSCSPAKKDRVICRDGFRCVYCGEGKADGVFLTVDHVIPVSRGGDSREDNLVAACAQCNQERGTMDYHRYKAIWRERHERGMYHAEAELETPYYSEYY